MDVMSPFPLPCQAPAHEASVQSDRSQPAIARRAPSPLTRAGVEVSARGAAAVSGAATSEVALIDALRRGDERVFAELVDRHGASMLRVARTYERDPAVAEEIVQDAWLGLLRGIERFEGRSSLRTWLFRIVANVARTRAVRESAMRSTPL
jgi:RNA polymerase sigma-70 factor, ECF subfamily